LLWVTMAREKRDSSVVVAVSDDKRRFRRHTLSSDGMGAPAPGLSPAHGVLREHSPDRLARGAWPHRGYRRATPEEIGAVARPAVTEQDGQQKDAVALQIVEPQPVHLSDRQTARYPTGRARSAQARPYADGGDEDYGVGVATGCGRPGVPRMRTRFASSVGSLRFAVSYRPLTWTCSAGTCAHLTAPVRVTEPEMTFVDGDRVT